MGIAASEATNRAYRQGLASDTRVRHTAMDHVEYAYTTGLEESAIEERLATTGTGVLSLAKGDDAYAIPVAHYYEDGRLYFRIGLTEGSKKQSWIEATESANYVVYGTEETDAAEELESWSVLIDGRLRELPAAERDRFDTAEINRQFTPIRVFDEEIDEMEIRIYELEIDSVAGRTTGE